MHTSCNILRLIKNGETYIFSYDDEPSNRDETLRIIAQFAANPELALTWYDAAMLSRKVRETPTCEESDDAINISPCCKQPHNRRCAD
jgi:hypothetical protein